MQPNNYRMRIVPTMPGTGEDGPAWTSWVNEHYWVRAPEITQRDGWAIGYFDSNRAWRIFGVSGCFEPDLIAEVGPIIERPAISANLQGE